MDLHRRRSVLARMTADGRKLETSQITNGPAELRRVIGRAGGGRGWFWRQRMGGTEPDTLAAAGAEVHLAHSLGVKGSPAGGCRTTY